jgi:4-amino-4-deoxy-L-arabinose transferase-like glycosyltransferase
MKHARWLAIVVVLWTALALRLAGISEQSIWYDEGLSIYAARGSIGDILRTSAQSEHPPLHSLLLRAWMALGGDSELSVRYLSAWWGVLAVALMVHLGRRLLSAAGLAWSGDLSALLMALSPLAVWFSQETRGYTLALALAIATVAVSWDLALATQPSRPGRGPGWARYLAYVLLASAALYAHLYSALVLVALNLLFLVGQLQRATARARPQWAQILAWAGAQLAVIALFAAWLPVVANQWQLNATYFHGAVDWKQVLRRTLLAYSVGKSLDGFWAIGATWAFVALIASGTLSLIRRRGGRWPLVLCWLWLTVPLAFQIALNRDLAKYSPRYLLNALPPFLLLASAGTLGLMHAVVAARAPTRRGWRLAALVALLLCTALIGGATTRSLASHYDDRSGYRPDIRAVAHYIEEHASPEDLIVILGGHGSPAFRYYYRGPLPVLPLPDRLLPDTRTPLDVRALETLDRALDGRQRLWLVLWQASLADPSGLITDELEHTYPRLGVGRTFHDVGLMLFDVSSGPQLAKGASPSVALSADFAAEEGASIRLLGYELSQTQARPGDTLYLYLYWQSMGTLHHDYKVFTQVLDREAKIVAQHDKLAGADAYPTSHWPPGTLVRDRLLLTLDPDTLPGDYTLIVGLYRPSRQMPRLPVEGRGASEDHIVLTQVEVERR